MLFSGAVGAEIALRLLTPLQSERESKKNKTAFMITCFIKRRKDCAEYIFGWYDEADELWLK